MDQTTPAIASTNPLAKHFRQASIYFKLPSGGQYWPPGSLDLPPNSEIGVMSMTTKDEITLKTHQFHCLVVDQRDEHDY
jgi:hypothetical protein